MTTSDMARVQTRADYSDSIAGTVFTHGLSLPMERGRAVRLAARMGPPAVVVDLEPPTDAPAPALPDAAGALPSSVAAEPTVAAVDTVTTDDTTAPVDASDEAAERPRKRGLKP